MSRQLRGLRRALALLALVMAVVAASVTLVPGNAYAMTTNKATARPNEDGGSGVIGGLKTRLTWEGTLAEDEEVTSVTLVLPDGGDFDGSVTRITVLEGLTRVNVDGEAVTDGNTITVNFAEPIPAGSLLRLEITNMSFPAAGGDIVVSGTYVNQSGEQPLQDSKPIVTIANTPLQMAVAWLDEQPWVEAWNSNQFLNMFLKPQLLLTSFVSLFSGWLVCLAIVIIAYPFAILLGLIFAFMKISRYRLLRAIAIVYINILRGTPLFLQIYIMFFGLPMVNINIPNFILGIIVMAINSSAYLAEIFRAGIQSIPVGQYEAAASLGMGRMQTMVSIILPQTVRRVIPTATSDFITAYKDTSLLSSVGVMELMMFSKNLTTVSGNITPYMAAAVYYLIVTLPLIKVVTIVENRLARNESGGGKRPPVKGKGVTAGEDVVEKAAEKDAESPNVAKARPSAFEIAMAPFRANVSFGGAADGR